MKKLLFSVLALFLTVGVIHAQEGEKAMKKADRALGLYHMDPSNNEDKLTEARDLMETAMKTPEVTAEASSWVTKGEIYNAMVGKEVNQLVASSVLDSVSYELPDDITEQAITAISAFSKGLEMAEKRRDEKDALQGLAETASFLNNIGNAYLQAQDYAEAYKPLYNVLKAQQIIVDNGGDPVLETEDDVDNTRYVVAFCASIAGDNAVAKELFDQLVQDGYEESGVYAAYANLLMNEEGMEEKTEEVLNKGKEMFPNDTEILFAEINYYLRQNRLDDLVGKLQSAIDKEPENPSLYSTLGNVYDNLFQREMEAENEEKAAEYFNEALKYYEQAVEIDPDYAEAVYSVGALYFNKAASVSQQMVAMEDDYSREGIKKYEALKEDMMGLFDEALPYFKKAESMNPNDINTLIALREIYARKNNIEMSNEFKSRMEKIQAGKTLEKSYFNE